MEKLEINTELDSFVLVDSLTKLETDLIEGNKTFEESPAWLGLESLAQLGSFHVRYQTELKRHSFLLKISRSSPLPKKNLTGSFQLTGKLISFSELAYSYHLELKQDEESVIEGDFLYGTVDYDSSFDQQILQQHYSKVLSCLKNATAVES